MPKQFDKTFLLRMNQKIDFLSRLLMYLIAFEKFIGFGSRAAQLSNERLKSFY